MQHLCYLRMLQRQVINFRVFQHWLSFVETRSYVLILSYLIYLCLFLRLYKSFSRSSEDPTNSCQLIVCVSHHTHVVLLRKIYYRWRILSDILSVSTEKIRHWFFLKIFLPWIQFHNISYFKDRWWNQSIIAAEFLVSFFALYPCVFRQKKVIRFESSVFSQWPNKLPL